jgi:hypothetical protein
MAVTYDSNLIEISLFDQQEYSSIFGLGHSPKTFYKVDTSSLSFSTMSLEFQNLQSSNNSIKNVFSNVFIGARYSNFFNNQFMFSLN